MNMKNISVLSLLFVVNIINCDIASDLDQKNIERETIELKPMLEPDPLKEIPQYKKLQLKKKELERLSRKLPFYQAECDKNGFEGIFSLPSSECLRLAWLLQDIKTLEREITYLDIEVKTSDEYLNLFGENKIVN